jgi:hypothetical protein
MRLACASYSSQATRPQRRSASAVRPRHDGAGETDGAARELVISYLSPRLFYSRTTPTRLSVEALFDDVFDVEAARGTDHTWLAGLLRRVPRKFGPGDDQMH